MTSMTITLNLGNTQALNSFDTITHMAFGDNNLTPTAAQTTMQNEILRVVLQSATKDTGANTYTFVGRIPITQFNTGTIEEIGLFDASSGGNMACRILSPISLNKTSDDELIITLVIKVNAKET